jgi:hypothetical protein
VSKGGVVLLVGSCGCAAASGGLGMRFLLVAAVIWSRSLGLAGWMMGNFLGGWAAREELGGGEDGVLFLESSPMMQCLGGSAFQGNVNQGRGGDH